MTTQIDEVELREAARHRGLRLVKSRRRKPGSGDFGLFGLMDADKRPLLGFGPSGLTATASDISAYLRDADVSTWNQSARITPSRPTSSAPSESPLQPDPPPEPPAPSTKRSEHQPRRTARSKPPARRRQRSSRRADAVKTAPRPKVEETPAPKISIRPATLVDARSICDLLAQMNLEVPPEEVKDRLTVSIRSKERALVAERGAVVGCLAWHVLPTLQHGPIGRITLLIVAPDERRRGIGRALAEAAFDEFRRHGCSMVEAMNDIQIRNAHGFFRSLDFSQTSYRFVRCLREDRTMAGED